MEKLTIEELAPYFPYGVKFKNLYNNEILRMDKLCSKGIEIERMGEESGYRWIVEFGKVKPILRPMSDMLKWITINGKKFFPAEVLFSEDAINIERWETFGVIPEYWQDCASVSPLDHDYRVVKKLFEWHFDVFGLIDRGLAIDINTLTPED